RPAPQRTFSRARELQAPKAASAARQPSEVAPEEPGRDLQPLLDPPPGGAHPRRVRGAVAVPGEREQAGVDVRAGERAGVALELLAPAEAFDLGADPIAGAGELLDRRLADVSLAVQLHQAVQGRPAQGA